MRFRTKRARTPFARSSTKSASGGSTRAFRIEFRTVAADDVWLSPFYQRESATIAVHQYHRVDTAKLFDACESIFRSVDGRPHWGKRHTRTSHEFAHLYPKFEAFRTCAASSIPRASS